jgi:two-component system, chemotaxis family, chemotaxis protein CheY
MDTVIESIDRVLVIDDNEIDALICAKTFQKFNESIQVQSFLGANEALKYLQDKFSKNPEELPDLILLDLYMPLMDGWLFLQEYKKIVEQSNKKIVLLMASSTTFDSDFSQMKNYKEVSGHISKPITIDKIHQIVEKYFQ